MNNRILRLTRPTGFCTLVLTGVAVGSAQAQEQPPIPPATIPATPVQPAAPQAVPPAPTPPPVPAPPAKPRRQLPFQRVYHPFRFQVGAGFPTGERTRDDINSAFFSGGLSVDLGATRATNPVYLGAYLDLAYGQNSNDAPVNRLISTGIGIMFRTYFSDVTSKTRYYAGAGVGAYTVAGKRDTLVDIPATIGDVTVSRLRYRANDTSRTSLGGKLFVGAEFDSRFFGEISFTGAGSSRGYSPTGPAVGVGIRF